MEGSSATDSATDVTDVKERRKKEEVVRRLGPWNKTLHFRYNFLYPEPYCDIEDKAVPFPYNKSG
ncbi:hypothetical protein QT972_25135 [Microcoleus sp. herbarium7]